MAFRINVDGIDWNVDPTQAGTPNMITLAKTGTLEAVSHSAKVLNRLVKQNEAETGLDSIGLVYSLRNKKILTPDKAKEILAQF